MMIKKIIAATLIFSILSVPLTGSAVFDVNMKPEGMNSWQEMKDMLSEHRYDEAEQVVKRDDRDKVDKKAYVRVDIDDTTALWESSKELLATGTEGPLALDELISEDLPNHISDEWKELAGKVYDIPTVRYGGGQSNRYDLWNDISEFYGRTFNATVFNDKEYERWGSEAERSRDIVDQIEGQENISIVDYIKAFEMINPDMAFIFCLSITHATAEDNLKFIRFCLDDPNESIYGQMRKELLYERPVKIACVEIGNEIYFRSIEHEQEVLDGMRETYANKFIEHAELINSYYPDLMFVPCLMCTDEVNNPGVHREWNEYILKTCGKYMTEHYPPGNRLLALHNYYGGTSLANSYKRIEMTFDSCVKIFGENHGFKALMSEHSKWATNYPPALTLYSALCSVEFLNRAYQWHDNFIWGAQYYGFHSQNLWAQVRRGVDGTLAPTSVSDAYDLYEKNIGDRVIGSNTVTLDDTAIGDMYNALYRYTACVFANGDDEIKIIMSNKTEDTDVDVSLNFATGNKYKLVKEEILTANNMYSFRLNKATENVIYTKSYDRNEENFTHYTMPAFSMVVLTLKSKVKLPKAGEKIDNGKWIGENRFDDIANEDFKGKINYIADAGIIDGVAERTFEPQQNVSRGEFAAMLCRIADKEPISSKNSFYDVSDGKWYSGYISAACDAGYMKGISENKFAPDENITLSEAITALYRCVSSVKNIVLADDTDIRHENFGFVHTPQMWEIPGLKFAVSENILNDYSENIRHDESYIINRAHAAGLLFAAHNILNRQEVFDK